MAEETEAGKARGTRGEVPYLTNGPQEDDQRARGHGCSSFIVHGPNDALLAEVHDERGLGVRRAR